MKNCKGKVTLRFDLSSSVVSFLFLVEVNLHFSTLLLFMSQTEPSSFHEELQLEGNQLGHVLGWDIQSECISEEGSKKGVPFQITYSYTCHFIRLLRLFTHRYFSFDWQEKTCTVYVFWVSRAYMQCMLENAQFYKRQQSSLFKSNASS